MAAAFKTTVAERQILLVGPYGVLGTGVIDAVAENPNGGSPQLRAAPRRSTGCRPHRLKSASISWTVRARRKPFHPLIR